jgi:SAM-dependent methyltransferase
VRKFYPAKPPKDIVVGEAWYLSQYPDVKAHIPGQFQSARDHFISCGYQEGRVPSKPTVDEAWYLATYPDVADAIRSGRAKSGYDHFIETGYGEGRKPNRKGDSPTTAPSAPSAFTLGQEMLDAANRLGIHWSCSPALNINDYMLQYVIKNSPRSIERGQIVGLAEFFEGGANDARQVEALMAKLGYAKDAQVLEFASGYGRVSRHLKLPNLTCCDIHADAIDFLRDKIGVKAILSKNNPSDFWLEDQFDFIFVLSLFSHLPSDLFGRWLEQLYSLLRPGGKLMFTASGEAFANQPLYAKILDPETGFGFMRHTDQYDLDVSIYGSTISLPAYVEKQILSATKGSGQIESFEPKAWWLMQDQWVVSKPSVSPVS